MRLIHRGYCCSRIIHTIEFGLQTDLPSYCFTIAAYDMEERSDQIPTETGDTELVELQNALEYRFKRPELLIQALTHKSHAHENRLKDNERLEFLGDAILQFIISDILVRNYPELPEGMLSKFRAVLVSESGLSRLAKKLQLGRYLFIGKGEEITGGREKNSILADTLEALFASIFLDSQESSGIIVIARVIQNLFVDEIINAEKTYTSVDHKTDFQEFVQKKRLGALQYKVIAERGPDHNKEFITALLVANEIYGIGRGRSKKTAEQNAAINAFEKIKERYDD
jgi:ribonuclease III